MTDKKMEDWFDHRKCKLPPLAGVSEKLGIEVNHHQTLETEQLGVGWCSLLSIMLALPL